MNFKKLNDEKKAVDFIKKTAEKWKKILGLNITFWVRKGDNEEALLSISYREPYNAEYTIFYSDKFVEEYKEYGVEYCVLPIIHELTHTLTDELYLVATKRYITSGEVEESRERLTDRLAYIFLKINKI
jgi:hypothetical protein